MLRLSYKNYQRRLLNEAGLARELATNESNVFQRIEATQNATNRQLVVFDSCVFYANSHGKKSESSSADWGLIAVENGSNDVVIRGCVFERNGYGSSALVVRQYSSCFIRSNHASGRANNLESKSGLGRRLV